MQRYTLRYRKIQSNSDLYRQRQRERDIESPRWKEKDIERDTENGKQTIT